MAAKTGKRKKRRSPAKAVVCLALVVLSCAMLYSVIGECITMIQLQNQIAENEAKLSELEEEQKTLEEDKVKLQDPEYIKYLVRGKFLVTKKGEQVFKLPAAES